MQFRDITSSEFSRILAKLKDVEHHIGAIYTVSGQHDEYGMTVLARDGSQCMALMDDPRHLDGLLADRPSVDAAPERDAILPGPLSLGRRGGGSTGAG